MQLKVKKSKKIFERNEILKLFYFFLFYSINSKPGSGSGTLILIYTKASIRICLIKGLLRICNTGFSSASLVVRICSGLSVDPDQALWLID